MMMFGVHLVRKCMVDFLVTEAEPNDEGAGGGAVNSTRMGKVKTELKLVKPLTSWSQHLASFCLGCRTVLESQVAGPAKCGEPCMKKCMSLDD